MSDQFSIITLTGDRSVMFSLCKGYVQRQTCTPTQWIIVDDGKVPVVRPESLQGGLPNTQVVYVKREHGKPSSFMNNLRTALSHVTTPNIIFMEDDDWYSPLHAEFCMAGLKKASIVGQAKSRYYNVAHRLYRVMGNTKYASLGQTAISTPLLADLKSLADEHTSPTGFDRILWDILYPRYTLLVPCSITSVGIKGGPGRMGIGIGHSTRDQLIENKFEADPDMKMLYQWIGSEALCYRNHRKL